MKRPASTNVRPAFSHVLFFLLAVIMFSISYAVSSLAATVRPQPTRRALQEIRPTFRRGYQGLLLPKTSRILVQDRAIHRRDPAGSSRDGRPKQQPYILTGRFHALTTASRTLCRTE